MTDVPASLQQTKARAMRRTMFACVGVVATMTGAAFAAVPLYELFCKVTGFGGTPRIAESEASRVADRVFTVRFDANVAPGLPWKFEPETPSVDVRAGETITVFYKIRNTSSSESVGIANFNVQPNQLGGWFNKLQCFCFNELTLKPGESMDAPVVFFVDPEIVKERELERVRTITLSYTFFPAKGHPKPLAEAKTGRSEAPEL